MMNRKTRMLSLLLCSVMLIGCLPTVTFASDSFDTYEPLLLNDDTLNASTVWGIGDTQYLMDGDGGFFSSDKQESGAFPDDGKITTSDGVPFQLTWTGETSYAGNDSIRFVGNQVGSWITSDPIVMKINTYGVYDKLYVLGTAGGFTDAEKSLNFTVTLNYADGTSSVTEYNLFDWYRVASALETAGIGYKVFTRMNKNGGIDPDFGKNGGPTVQSKEIECDETKILESIQFQITNTASSVANEYGIYAAVYAVTGVVKSGAPEIPTNRVQRVGANDITVEWTPVDGAASYAVDVSLYPSFQDENGEASFITGYLNKIVNGTTLKIEGLDRETTYYCRVRAVGQDGAQSKSSNVVNATTTAAAPEATEGAVVPRTGDDAQIGMWVSMILLSLSGLLVLLMVKRRGKVSR